MKKTVQVIWLCLLGCLSFASVAQERVYTVGVANFQANLSMAAQLNPILKWVGQRAGVELVMKSGYNFDDMQRHLARGEYDFYIGFPSLQSMIRQSLSYKVIAALEGEAKSAIIVQYHSPYQTLADLNGHEVAMGSHGIFITNVVPMSVMLAEGVRVKPVTVGNQESLVTEFKLGKHQAVAVNLEVFKRIMGKNNHPYRILWQSPPLMNYPLTVRADVVPNEVVQRVQEAFIHIAQDEDGQAILERSNQRPGIQWKGWKLASEHDYQFAIQCYQRLSAGKRMEP
ncbi:MAG: PhnD/SsuA/transferrin family substrate-binding protein [Gammaproteobacteria bacterium]|nr:PhnD/SsuA/transferrin family substrate-binding protein [Gammaproteobacteria bacterium]